ncbi:MAG: MotE family protein [Cohaesibacteraceae bacterium]
MRQLRLLPMVILTALMLLGLKGFNLIAGTHGSLSGVDVAQAQQAEADTMAEGEAMEAEMDGEGMEAGMADVEDAEATEQANGGDIRSVTDLPVETSRDLLLERLGDRRQVLEEREQDLRIREQLLQAAENRLEERLAELEALEQRVSAYSEEQEQRESEEIGRLVQVYSAMRAKDAAAIFDLLDLPILMEVANAMNPRKMADILGQMNPEAARRLTIALAGTSQREADFLASPEDGLPRIEGVPVQ